jgi:hypothetical protein
MHIKIWHTKQNWFLEFQRNKLKKREKICHGNGEGGIDNMNKIRQHIPGFIENAVGIDLPTWEYPE